MIKPILDATEMYPLKKDTREKPVTVQHDA